MSGSPKIIDYGLCYTYTLKLTDYFFSLKVIVTYEFECQTELWVMAVTEQAEFCTGEMMFTWDLQSTMCSQYTANRVFDKNIREVRLKENIALCKYNSI